MSKYQEDNSIDLYFPVISRMILDIDRDRENVLGKIIQLYSYILTNQTEIQKDVIARENYRSLYLIILNQIYSHNSECIEGMRRILDHTDYEQDHDCIMKNINIIREYNTCMAIMNCVRDRAIQSGFHF